MLQYVGLQARLTMGQAFKALSLIFVIAIVVFLARLYQIRMMVRRAQREYDVPMMPHSFLFGHLISAAKLLIKYKVPGDHHGQWTFHFIRKEYPHIAEQGLLYLDPWPIGFPIIAVFDPALMSQFTQDHSLPKWWEQGHRGFKHFTGAKDIVHVEGKEWKELRSIFNPGFAARNILALVPSFIDEVDVFRKCLDKAAQSGETIPFRQLTCNLTVDVVSRAVLGAQLNTQTKPNKLITLMNKQLGLLYIQLNLQKQLSPTRHLKHWIYNRGIRNELLPLIRQTALNYERIEGPKTIVALALKSYMEEIQSSSSSSNHHPGSIPPQFLDNVVQNIKMFMFAGHDTTSTTLSYLYYLLSRNPHQLSRLRAEHTSVLGPDPAAASSLISRDPTLLNSLPYTSAAIRETLRLFPPTGGTIRQSPPGHFLVHPSTSRRYPTHGFILHSSVSTLGRDEKLYGPDAQEFRPERWLLSEEEGGKEGGSQPDNDTSNPTPTRPPRGAWRPFEVGPRNCIGQELAQMELRLVMALTAREYEVEERYDEGGKTSPWGDKAYQTSSPDNVANTLIKDGLPVVVKRVGVENTFE